MNDKTIADVASETIGHLANGVEKISAAVSKVAPHAWETAVRRQLVEGLTNIALTVMGIVLLGVAVRVFTRAVSIVCEGDHDEKPAVALARVLATVAALTLALLMIATWGISGIQQVTNPEYYAAIDILGRAK